MNQTSEIAAKLFPRKKASQPAKKRQSVDSAQELKITRATTKPGEAMNKLANITASAVVKMSDEELKPNAGFYAAKLALAKMAEESKKNPKKAASPTKR